MTKKTNDFKSLKVFGFETKEEADFFFNDLKELCIKHYVTVGFYARKKETTYLIKCNSREVLNLLLRRHRQACYLELKYNENKAFGRLCFAEFDGEWAPVKILNSPCIDGSFLLGKYWLKADV